MYFPKEKKLVHILLGLVIMRSKINIEILLLLMNLRVSWIEPLLDQWRVQRIGNNNMVVS